LTPNLGSGFVTAARQQREDEYKMTEQSQYGISAVRYDDKHERIASVRAHGFASGKLNPPFDMSRNAVILLIENGAAFATFTKDAAGAWTKGQPVKVVAINNVKFIKTVENDKECDNLGSLPEF
jgi:hypothetical protein